MTGLDRKQYATGAWFVWLWFVLTAGIGLVGFLLFMRNAAKPVPASADDLHRLGFLERWRIEHASDWLLDALCGPGGRGGRRSRRS